LSENPTNSRRARLNTARASASRLSGEWSDDDFDVLADGESSAASLRSPRRR
jgi:hypothetical protein